MGAIPAPPTSEKGKDLRHKCLPFFHLGRPGRPGSAMLHQGVPSARTGAHGLAAACRARVAKPQRRLNPRIVLTLSMPRVMIGVRAVRDQGGTGGPLVTRRRPQVGRRRQSRRE